ncbi:methyltransferase domain-containing protein [Pseudomaricurvus alkylphenolicus]|uniref:methyltransferase domain-containing protein n=1 Tax=Pseudomaricurvus alkylphenolicus TaxID=1306991 RepID=UPI00142418B4|nr:methyltransferase domain-containing protein [Pseudomaricurvus alkylphenolicus]NIB44539.1 methyltransferase domain-containing protein [Pseudomaricurvus alkylphenolicus]
MSNEQDRNFDDLARRFKRNVYDRLKGDIRLAVLERDLDEHAHELLVRGDRPWRILDAGGGQGQFSLALAKRGHQVTLCDHSEEMLKLAQARAEEEGLGSKVDFRHCSIQSLVEERLQPFDLILCHAVLEWVANPEQLLQCLMGVLAPKGLLSLTFYNVNSIKMKNLLRTNFKKVIEDDYRGYRGSLTPTWPRQPEEVYGWLAQLPLTELCHSGIRCFHDYILEPEHRTREPQQQLQLELRLSREEPWRSLGRYIHVLSRKH